MGQDPINELFPTIYRQVGNQPSGTKSDEIQTHGIRAVGPSGTDGGMGQQHGIQNLSKNDHQSNNNHEPISLESFNTYTKLIKQ